MPVSVSIMTAETLKPFITPTSAVDNFPATQSCGTTSRSQHKRNIIMIALAVMTLSVVGILLGFTIWHSLRVSQLERDVVEVNKIIESLQKRLGIHYLEDLHDFEKEYANALIDDPNTLDDADIADDDQDDDDLNGLEDDDEDDDDDDEDEIEYGEYTDLIKKYEDYSEGGEHEDDEEADAVDKDNLFDDFEKFQDSKNKKQRKQRSIAESGNEIQKNYDFTQQNKTQQENTDEERSKPKSHSSEVRRTTTTLRTRTSRRRKLPVLKNGESLISAKSSSILNSVETRPAAHFHLNRKINHHSAAIKLDSYPGDMYIGHSSSTNNEQHWQQYFYVENGVLTVRESGLYYIYAQICYNNTHDQNGFVIFHGHKPFLQCLNTVPTNLPFKIHTCHTSGLIHLQENETLHLRDFHTDRNVILKDDNNRSYFGIIKV